MTRWYRAYEGTVTDAKLGEVAFGAGCSRSVAIAAWHSILESCAGVNDGGRFDMTPRRVAVILGEPVQSVEAVFAEFACLGMIADNVVTAWVDRQFESDSSTERSRKHRQRKRDADPTLQQRDATPGNSCATPPESESDTHPEKKESSSLRSEDTEGRNPDREPVDAKPRSNVRGTRLRPDWEPDEVAWTFAIAQIGERAAETELAKFRDYWTAKAGASAVKLDWGATWSYWVRTAKERRQPARASPAYSRPYRTNGFMEAIIESQRDADQARNIHHSDDYQGAPTDIEAAR